MVLCNTLVTLSQRIVQMQKLPDKPLHYVNPCIILVQVRQDRSTKHPTQIPQEG